MCTRAFVVLWCSVKAETEWPYWHIYCWILVVVDRRRCSEGSCNGWSKHVRLLHTFTSFGSFDFCIVMKMINRCTFVWCLSYLYPGEAASWRFNRVLLHRKKCAKNLPKRQKDIPRGYIGNFSWDITEEDIRSLFVDCKIDAIRFSLNKTTGEFQGFGHVDFADDQQSVLGRAIKISHML